MKRRQKLLLAFIERHIKEGFLSAEQIVERALSEFEDYMPRVRLISLAQKLVYHVSIKRYVEEINWTELTDCDRLDQAFAELNKIGIVARQHFSCCNSCGHRQIDAVLKREQGRRKVWGFAFFHAQDTEMAVRSGVLFITYDSADKRGKRAIEVGRRISDALRKAGLNVEWDGSYLQRVCVTGLKWQKRKFAQNAPKSA